MTSKGKQRLILDFTSRKKKAPRQSLKTLIFSLHKWQYFNMASRALCKSYSCHEWQFDPTAHARQRIDFQTVDVREYIIHSWKKTTTFCIRWYLVEVCAKQATFSIFVQLTELQLMQKNVSGLLMNLLSREPQMMCFTPCK